MTSLLTRFMTEVNAFAHRQIPIHAAGSFFIFAYMCVPRRPSANDAVLELQQRTIEIQKKTIIVQQENIEQLMQTDSYTHEM